MLTTLLEIGSVLRKQPGAEGIKYHRYVRPAPRGKKEKGQVPKYYEVAVSDNMNFDLSTATPIYSETIIEEELFYLNYKSSDADSMKKYIFGDICRYQEKIPKSEMFTPAEVNFDLGNPNSGAKAFRNHSFDRGRQDAVDLQDPTITTFRKNLERQMDALLAFFEQEKSVYINFRFGNERKHWYELDVPVEAINTKILRQFVIEEKGKGYVLVKSLYKTIGSGKETAPQFSHTSLFKAWAFPDLERVSDLIYAIDISQKAMIRKGDIKIVVLPRSDQAPGSSRLSALEIERFLNLRTIRAIAEAEGDIADRQDDENEEEESSGPELTRPYEQAQQLDTITQFDFIFSKASSSPSTPDVDVIELSGVSKSRIQELYNQIKVISKWLQEDRIERFQQKNYTFKKTPYGLRLLNSINEILGEVGREKKKYSSHLLKILPQIYCGTYIADELLLPAFIETNERKLREGSPSYDFLRYDLMFLLKIQDVNRGYSAPARKDIEMLKKVQDTASYRIGQLLGKMARPLRKAISSFEKNYVGLLSRRVAQIDDVIALQNFIDQKLILHDRSYPNLKIASRELTALINRFPESGETYNREHCVYGFFESYFEPIPAKTEDNEATDVISDLTDNQEE